MGRLAIIINKDDNYNAVNRILNAINHPEIAKIERIFEGATKKELTTGYSHVLLVGTEMIKKYLGAGVAGRNAVIQLDDVWYFTMPNPAALYTQSVAVRAANQVIRAIQSLDNPNFYFPKIPKYEISTYAELEQLVNECLKSEFMSFDFETNNMLQTRHPDFKATCLGICFTPGFSWIIPHWMLYDKSCLVQLERIFCSKDLTKIAHNLSFDYKVLKRLGITPKGRYSCTKILSWLIDENTPNGLKEAVDWYLPDFSGYDYHVDFSKDVDQDLYEYLAIDAHVTLCLYCIFIKELSKDQALYVAFRNIYMPSLFVLAEMEWGGCYVDKNYLDEESVKIDNLITQRVNEIQEMPEVQGWVISKNKELVAEAIQELTDKIATRKLKFTNPDDRYILDWTDKIKKYKSGELYCIDSCDVNSPKVLAELLYTKNGFNFPNPMREDKGAKGKKKVESNSTDKDALNDIDHPIGQKLRAIRTLEKMNGTYYKGVSDLVIDGKVYANFNQTGAVTGRLSSSSPNLQNLPTRVTIDDPEVKAVIKGVKKAFYAPEGYVVMQADLSQAELRIIAHLSKDENMINAYKEGKDLHAITASRIAKMQDDFEAFLKHPDFKEFRNKGKSATFGLVYDISLDGYIAYIKAQTGNVITKADAQLHADSVFGAYPNIKKWHQQYKDLVTKDGYVRNLFGIRRRLPEIWSTDQQKVSSAVRLAINNPVQGTIGLWAQWLMIWLKLRLPSSVMIWSTVHDSIVLYVPTDMVEEVSEVIKELENIIPTQLYFDMETLAVPLKMDIEVGDSYGNLSEIKK